MIFIEDEFENYSKHKHLVARGYKLVRRTGYNNWYVPRETPVSAFSLSSTRQLIRLCRKKWLGPVAGIWKRAKTKFKHWVKNTEAILLEDPRNPFEIASAIERLMNPDIREAYSNKGRDLVRELSWDRTANIIIQTLEKSARERGRE